MTTNAKARLVLTAIVCAAAFKISFGHIYDVALHAGNSPDNAIVYPVAIDAVILVSALYLVANQGVNKMAKLYATAGRLFGFAATIYCNMAASGWSNPGDVVINMIPAISLIITVELLVYGFKATPAARTSQAARKAAPRKASAPKAAKATTTATRRLNAV